MYLVREFGKLNFGMGKGNPVISKEITLLHNKNLLDRPLHFRKQMVPYKGNANKVNEIERPIHFRNQVNKIVKKEVNELDKPIHFRNSISREDFIKVFKTN